jgi:hypothetical protein
LQAAPADLVQVATGSVGGVHAIPVERRVVANAERGSSGKAGGVAGGLAHRGARGPVHPDISAARDLPCYGQPSMLSRSRRIR